MASIEIQVLSRYLTDNLLDSNQRLKVYLPLAQKLQSKFIPHHWFPSQPERGSGYRAISFDPARQDGYLDPVLCIIAQLLAVSTKDLRRIILKNMVGLHPSGWTIWCDPGCVSIRLRANGGELKEIWGNLPHHLSNPWLGTSPSPPNTFLQPPPPTQSPSPNKSRAIPILAPTSAPRPTITPPNPHSVYSSVINSPGSNPEEEDELIQVKAMLHDHLNPTLRLPSCCPSIQDRPISRASCASSSSDGSDNSAFSSSSSSTATSIAPLALHMAQKLNSMKLQNGVAPQFPTRFIRHHSSSSFPFNSSINPSSFPAQPLATLPSLVARSASLAHPGHRRRHVPTSSISSTGSGRGLLVLKGGPGTVTEHSGGKVGVMGGGVLLGLPKDKESAAITNNNARRVSNRRLRTRLTNS